MAKYVYLHVVQGQYELGWEDLIESESRREALVDLKAYRENETGYAHRLIQRRELAEEDGR